MNKSRGGERDDLGHGVVVHAAEFAVRSAEGGDRGGLSFELGEGVVSEPDDGEAVPGSYLLEHGEERWAREVRHQHGGLHLEDEAGHRERNRCARGGGEDTGSSNLPGVEGSEGDLAPVLLEEEHTGIAADGVVFKHIHFVK
jgi:hypothetical protein